jgi:iron-sulfur cluster repair protein YtfE (RIC family)
MVERVAVDLLKMVEHEHEHLVRLFSDIRLQFESIAPNDSSSRDFYTQAVDDLDTALEEMLEHFDQEEQVVFPAFEAHRPDLADRIAGLARAHEAICTKTRRLREIMFQFDDLAADPSEARGLVDFLCRTLTSHTKAEYEVFVDALRDVAAAEQRALIDMLAAI